jgi:hypothetical protein
VKKGGYAREGEREGEGSYHEGDLECSERKGERSTRKGEREREGEWVDAEGSDRVKESDGAGEGPP